MLGQYANKRERTSQLGVQLIGTENEKNFHYFQEM